MRFVFQSTEAVYSKHFTDFISGSSFVADKSCRLIQLCPLEVVL